MVKGLKVLRHKRTEVGYFNEFLIAKTPDDVENCPFTTAALVPVTTVATPTPGVTVSLDFQQQMQTGAVYSPTIDFIFDTNATANGPHWQYHQQHVQQQQQQQQPILVCSGQPAGQVLTFDADVARQEVVVTSSATNSASAAASSMAAGMSKMKLSLGRRDAKQPRVSPPQPSTASTPAPSSVRSSTSTMPDDTWQRRANRRRERNRAAAARFRKKRQDQLDGLAAEVRELEAERTGLESRVAGLSAARSDLLRRLREHQLACPETAGFTADAYGSMATNSLAPLTAVSAMCSEPQQGDVILLTPSLLLPPPLPSSAHPGQGVEEDDDDDDVDRDDPFKLEPL